MNVGTKVPVIHAWLTGMVLTLSLGIARGEQIRVVVTASVAVGYTNQLSG